MFNSALRFSNPFNTAERTPNNPQLRELKNWVADPTEGKDIYPNYWAGKGWRCIKAPYKH
jgi:hypothetical protein